MNEFNQEKTIKKESEETGRLDRIYFDEKGGLKMAAVKNEFEKHNAKLIQAKSGDLIFAVLLKDAEKQDEYLENLVSYEKHGNVSEDKNPFYNCYADFVKYFRNKTRSGGMYFSKDEFKQDISDLSEYFHLDKKELESFFKVNSYDRFILINRETKPAFVAVTLMHEINHLKDGLNKTALVELAKKIDDISGKKHFDDSIKIYEILTDIRALSLVPEEALNLTRFGYLSNLHKKDLFYLRELIYDSGAKNTKDVLEFLKEEIAKNNYLESVLRKEFPGREDHVWESIKNNFYLIINEVLDLNKSKQSRK